MNASHSPGNLPEGLSRKLCAIRRRALGLALARLGILALAALFGCMVVAMVLDWNFAWLHPVPRYIATSLTALLVLVLVLVLRPRLPSIRGTARNVDEAIPQLEERWSTVTELAQSQDSPEVRGSEAMINRVASEADTAAQGIAPESLVSSQPVIGAARWLSGAVALLVILFTINFTEAALLAQRFWMPGKNISLTQISASPANTWVAKGEPLTITATLKGRIPRERPALFIRGTRMLTMDAKPSTAATFTHAIEDVTASFEFQVRAGDGQTPWLALTAVDRPRISEVKLKVTPPAYTKFPPEEKSALPQSVRILKGSDFEVKFRVDQPLDRMFLDFGNGQSAALTAEADDWYRFTARPTNDFAFVAAALNKFKLENKTKPSSRVTVYEDLVPTVKVIEPSDDIAVLPGEKVEVAFEAKDDFGISKVELQVETIKADGITNSLIIPIDLQKENENKEVRKNVQIDTKALGLKHGDQLSYKIQVKDTKAEPASSQPKAADNEMSKRMLDVAQTGECKPRNIMVDEHAGSFDGDKREQLEIAIDPVLKRLDQLLAQAQTNAAQRNFEPAKTNLTTAQHAVADLTSATTGTPYAFIGLQLQNIAQAHISPAGEYLSETNAHKAEFHIARARELLATLTKTYETVKRDQQVADAMQRLSKMYDLFLEDTQALLGNKRDPINSYDRKVAEVDEQFAEKLKELLEERKKIMAELAQLLADDPRLLRRYLAMMELQGTTLRDQFTLLAARQKEIQQQLADWNVTPDAERGAKAEKLRQEYAAQNKNAAEDAARLRENMETWLPLDVKPEQKQVQDALERAEKIVRLASETDTNAAHQALSEMHALREALPRFSELESTNKARLATYIANRLPEVESLITAHSGQMKIMESLNARDFTQAAEVVQHRIHQDTYTLGEKMISAEEQLGPMSEEIFQSAAALNRAVQGNIIHPQRSSVEKLAAKAPQNAEQILNKIPPAFDDAEKKFDHLMKLVIAELDKAPPPGDPGGTDSLEDILSLLEDEAKACENLGIPCRPLNVSIMRDWMRPGQNNGTGSGSASVAASQAQAQQGKEAAERMKKQARDSAQKALSEARKQRANLAANAASATPAQRSEAWNKLASRLQKDLLQGRDNVPPEQYRAAIEAYFRIIAETTAASEK